MKVANLDKNKNLWYAVHDFNDEQKTKQNWSCIKGKSSPWFPLGEAEGSISSTGNTTFSSETTDELRTLSNSEDSPRQGIVSSIFAPSSFPNNSGGDTDNSHPKEQKDLSNFISSKSFIFTFIYSFIQQSYHKATTIWNQLTLGISGWFQTR